MLSRVSKWCVMLSIAAMLVTAAAGCASKSSSGQKAPTATRTLVDMCGKSVQIPTPANIERVAILTSPAVQLIYVVGAQDKLCAMTASQSKFKLFEKFYPRQAEIPAPRKMAAELNVEALLATNPQFCIGSEPDMDIVDKNTKLPTVRIKTQVPADQVFENHKLEVKMFGDIFAREERAERYCGFLDAMLADIKSKTKTTSEAERVKVYMGYNPDHLTTYGGDTFMEYLIAAAGCKNAASPISTLGGKEGGLATASFEQVLSWNPDVIVVDYGKPEDLARDPIWGRLDAVKKGRVFRLPVGGFLWNRNSAESCALLPLWLATVAYPDRFPGDVIQSQIKRYYREIYGFDLSDEDVRGILNPADEKPTGSQAAGAATK